MPLLAIAAALALRIVVQRTSLDLLDSLPVAITVQNSGPAPVTARFPQPAEYRLDLTDGSGTVVWTSQAAPTPGASFPVHERRFAPGVSTLVVYAWNQLASGGWSPLAGTYLLKARLLSTGDQPEKSVTVRFVAPLSPGSIAELKAGEVYTIAGMLDASGLQIADARGSARLSHRLMGAPNDATLVARGHVVAGADGTRSFFVERWARLGPPPHPAPVSSS
ncbi:MAG: hypothetical protein JOY98_09195 [Candidatus Eremiobacteraeota bacterium]|nr:hypothetical protein [Candidatus Eremiobacteraeota bacterium]